MKRLTKERIEKLKSLISKRSANVDYLLDKINNPEWLDILYNIGIFNSPYNLIRNENNKIIGALTWKQSKYLAKMALSNPKKIIEIILNTKTNNYLIIEDFIDAALNIVNEHPDYAARFIKYLNRWIQNGNILGFNTPQKAIKLINRIAQKGKISEAFTLVKTLLQIFPDDDFKNDSFLQPQPHFRFEAWIYEGIFKKDIPELLHISGENTFDLLCDLLKDALIYSLKEAEKSKPYDVSYIWRPAIEDHSQNMKFDIKDTLVNAVRDAAQWLVEKNKVNLSKIIEKLENRSWYIFKRLEFHLLRMFPNGMDSEIIKRLTNFANFDNTYLQHEYVLLMKEHFNNLIQEDKDKIFGWIESGPNMKWFKGLYKKEDRPDPTREEEASYIKHWKAEKLYPIKDFLTKEWQKKYYEIISAIGEPEHPEFASYHSDAVWGPRSPKNEDEIESMPIPELIAFIKEWKPSGQWKEDTKAGFARSIGNVFQKNIKKYNQQIALFKDADINPVYIRFILHGYVQAFRDNNYIDDWKKICDFCNWVINQKDDAEEETSDNSWNKIKGVIADLLEEGLQIESDPIPFELRKSIWKILKVVVKDKEPDLEYEKKYGGDNMDPLTLSINTARGKAMHAVFRYAIWVRKYWKENDANKDKIKNGLSAIPEVKEVLEGSLNPENEPTETIRAVFGQWLPQLIVIDKEWVKKNLSKLLPENKELKYLKNAFWETYLKTNRLYTDVYQVLKKQYREAVVTLPKIEGKKDILNRADMKLAEHIILLFIWEKIRISDENDLLVLFFENASPKLRKYALNYIGRSLESEKKINPEFIKKAKELWEWRLEILKSKDNEEESSIELASFYLWINTGRIENEWWIKHLKELLNIKINIEMPVMVIEKLRDGVKQYSELVIDCLELIIMDSEDQLLFAYGKEKIKWLLKDLLVLDSDTIKEKAINLVHYIGSLGYFDFRELLEDGKNKKSAQ